MGCLIAFDGIDASGKTTQTKILEKKLRESNPEKEIVYLTFPVYDSGSSALVKLYLGGELGQNPEGVNAYAASSFFAADRYISYISKWKKYHDNENCVILANRYTTANAMHQLSKLPENEWTGFLDWLYDYEFDKLKIPRPDLTLFFDMHPDVSIKLIEERAKKTNAEKDIHEADANHLRKSYEAGQFAAKYLGWEKIICYKKDSEGVLIPRTEEEISRDVFELVEKNI